MKRRAQRSGRRPGPAGSRACFRLLGGYPSRWNGWYCPSSYSGISSSCSSVSVDIRELIPAAVARGGHVRVGLEDAPLGTETTNLEWVEQAAAAIERAGGQVATAAEVRACLGQGAAHPS